MSNLSSVTCGKCHGKGHWSADCPGYCRLCGKFVEGGSEETPKLCDTCCTAYEEGKSVGKTENTLRAHANKRLAERNSTLQGVLKELLDCPYVIDEATVPKAGVDAAPDQVVGTMHVALPKMRKLRAALGDKHPWEDGIRCGDPPGDERCNDATGKGAGGAADCETCPHLETAMRERNDALEANIQDLGLRHALEAIADECPGTNFHGDSPCPHCAPWAFANGVLGRDK